MKLQPDEFYKICLSIPFLACLSPEELAQIEKDVVIKQFLKNEVILAEEEASEYFYFIFSGKVKVMQFNESGREQILAIHKRGDYFGEMALIDGKTAPATIMAIENCVVGFLSKINFTKHILNNGKSMHQIILLLCSRLRDSWLMLKVLSFSDAHDRVRVVLNIFSQKFGVTDDRGRIINLKLTHKDIADFIALSRETTTRTLNYLEKSQEIEIIDNKYILLRHSFFKKVPFM